MFAQLRVGVRGLLHALFAKKLGIAPVKLFFGEEQVFGSLHSVAQKLLGGGSAQQTWGQRDAERFLKQNGVHQAVFYTTSRHMSIISERPVRDVVCVGTQEAYVVCAPERWVKGGEQSNKIEEIILGSDIQALRALVWHLSSNCDGDMIDVAVAELQERENLLWGLQSVKTRIDSLILPGSKTRTLSQSDKEEFSIELLRYHLLIPLFERNAVLWGDIGGLLCVYLDYLRELTSMMNAPPFRKKLSENRESEAERTILTGAQELLSARIPSGNETKIW